MQVYTFDGELEFSDSAQPEDVVCEFLMEHIPGAERVSRATKEADKNGTDWWVHREVGMPVSVDAKVRRIDYGARGQDDLLLEIWSVKERRIPGWTARKDKATDYVLYLWMETKRLCLVPFPMLHGVFKLNFHEWLDLSKRRANGFSVRMTSTETSYGGYHTEFMCVPRLVVWQAIVDTYGGALPEAPE